MKVAKINIKEAVIEEIIEEVTTEITIEKIIEDLEVVIIPTLIEEEMKMPLIKKKEIKKVMQVIK